MGAGNGSGRRGGVRARSREETVEKESLTYAKLKKENESLKRAIARLRKRLDRYELEDWEEDEVVVVPAVLDKNAGKPKCPECGSHDFQKMDMPSRVLLKCSTCGCRWAL